MERFNFQSLSSYEYEGYEDYEGSIEDYVEEGSRIPQFIRNVKSCSTSEHEMAPYRISAAIYFFIFYLLPAVVGLLHFLKFICL